MCPANSYSLHVALLIDVMGQKAVLSDASTDPLEPGCLDRLDMKDLYNNSAGKIQRVCKNLNGFLKCRTGEQAPVEISTQFFSDCMLFSFPVEMTDDSNLKEKQLNHIFTLFYAASMSQLSFLAEGTPLRGGIDLGLGVSIPDVGLYGPVNFSVDHLEKKVARYPRIAVGETLRRFIKNEELYCTALCGTLRNMCISRDDCFMIDFLGPLISCGMRETKTRIGPFTPLELVERASNCIQSSRDGFARSAREENENEKKEKLREISAKYRFLDAYFRERMDLYWKR